MSIRKRVSQACTLCALRKIKCDGGLPTCSPCRNRNEDCSYASPKRRRMDYPATLSATPTSRLDAAESLAACSTPVIWPKKSPNGGQVASASRIKVPVKVSKILFEAYFEGIHPMWPLLYKPLYTTSDYIYPSPGIPDPLAMAIFTTASCLDRSHLVERGIADQSQSDKDVPKPQALFEEALYLLQRGSLTGDTPQPINALNPSIVSCQVLVILALQQHGIAEYSRAAIMCGLAAAMAIELRLNREYEIDDPIEREIRYRLWWNLYILDKMISGEMGRPIVLRAEETDCPWPSVSETDEFELMSSHPQPHDSPIQARRKTFKMRTISAFHTTISLSMIMERMYRKVYGVAARKAIRDDQRAGEKLRMQFWLELQKWERDIEASSLKLDMSSELMSAPATVTNYVIMWTATILLHRPFISQWQPDLAFTEAAVDPFEISLQAANQICQVLEKYLECLPRGPCDMIFSIFVAAGILLQHLKQGEIAATGGTRRRLKLCIHWLSLLGKSWKIAGERRQLLNDMFDLPQEFQDPKPTHGSTAIQSILQQAHPGDIPVDRASGQLQTSLSSAEDWSFLQKFGDSTDQFYAWDVDLRDLLGGQYDIDGLELT